MSLNTQLNSSSVILVSGGGRGVTAQCVIKIAENYQCKFVLLGRSSLLETEPQWAENCFDESELKKRIMQTFIAQGDKPTPAKVQQYYSLICQSREINQTIVTIQKLGGKTEYLAVDITNQSALSLALIPVIQRLGSPSGIIHGAGNLADKLIENKTEQDFEKVYNVKIEGLNNLLNCLDKQQLNFIVLFSSFVAFYGNIGQSDYALANEILNKYAYLLQRQYPHCHVVSIGWGPWDGGMVTPELKKIFSQQNIEVIPSEVGSQFLLNELTSSSAKNPQTIVMSNPIVATPIKLKTVPQNYRIYRRLNLKDNPFIYDHVIGGNGVLPAMSVMSWLASLGEQLYPGYKFLSCSQYQVLKGIIFDETIADSYCLDLTETYKDPESREQIPDPKEIELESLIWSVSQKKIPQYHYKAKIKLLAKNVDAKSNNIKNFQVDNSSQITLAPYQDGTLFHGKIFQGIKEIIVLESNSLTVKCFLPKLELSKQGQFLQYSFNSYTADLLFQSLLIWVKYFYQLGSLPLQVDLLEQFEVLPFDQEFYITLFINSTSETKVVASGVACDQQGKVYLKAENMQVTVSSRLNSLFLQNSLEKNQSSPKEFTPN